MPCLPSMNSKRQVLLDYQLGLKFMSPSDLADPGQRILGVRQGGRPVQILDPKF